MTGDDISVLGDALIRMWNRQLQGVQKRMPLKKRSSAPPPRGRQQPPARQQPQPRQSQQQQPPPASQPSGGRDYLPFLRASDIDGHCLFTISGVRNVPGKYGRQIMLDGLADGEGRTVAIKGDSSTMENLLRHVAVGRSVNLVGVPFTTRDGQASAYIDLSQEQPE